MEKVFLQLKLHAQCQVQTPTPYHLNYDYFVWILIALVPYYDQFEKFWENLFLCWFLKRSRKHFLVTQTQKYRLYITPIYKITIQHFQWQLSTYVQVLSNNDMFVDIFMIWQQEAGWWKILKIIPDPIKEGSLWTTGISKLGWSGGFKVNPPPAGIKSNGGGVTSLLLLSDISAFNTSCGNLLCLKIRNVYTKTLGRVDAWMIRQACKRCSCSLGSRPTKILTFYRASMTHECNEKEGGSTHGKEDKSPSVNNERMGCILYFTHIRYFTCCTCRISWSWSDTGVFKVHKHRLTGKGTQISQM